MKKMRQKGNQGNKKRSKNSNKMEELNNNCTILWAKLTHIGLGLATTLQKQVALMICLDINMISLAGKFDNEE